MPRAQAHPTRWQRASRGPPEPRKGKELPAAPRSAQRCTRQEPGTRPSAEPAWTQADPSPRASLSEASLTARPLRKLLSPVRLPPEVMRAHPASTASAGASPHRHAHTLTRTPGTQGGEWKSLLAGGALVAEFPPGPLPHLPQIPGPQLHPHSPCPCPSPCPPPVADSGQSASLSELRAQPSTVRGAAPVCRSAGPRLQDTMLSPRGTPAHLPQAPRHAA